MKLKNELEFIKERFETISKDKVKDYMENIKKSGEYNNLKKRVVWDFAHGLIGSQIICEWYKKYNCNDNHIETVIFKAFDDVFGKDFIQN